ncbi:MAG: hypothetical protein WC319_09255 [Candidatus Paceibacterota bacterium]|jgi:deoxyxylulose-5-phosphate synthase
MDKKKGGRKKGTPNKVTADLRRWVEVFLNDNLPDIEKSFGRLEDYQKWLIVEKLLQYTIPKMQSVSVEAMVQAKMKALAEILEEAPEQAIDLIIEKILQIEKG